MERGRLGGRRSNAAKSVPAVIKPVTTAKPLLDHSPDTELSALDLEGGALRRRQQPLLRSMELLTGQVTAIPKLREPDKLLSKGPVNPVSKDHAVISPAARPEITTDNFCSAIPGGDPPYRCAQKAWLSCGHARDARDARVRLELDGDVLEVVGVSSREQRRLIQTWIDRRTTATGGDAVDTGNRMSLP